MVTLHKAIEAVIKQEKRSLTVSEITRLINADKLYCRKKDNKPLDEKQVMLRLGNHLDEFIVSVSLRD